MKKIIFSGLLLATLSGCTDRPNTVRTLEAMGMTEVQTHGYSLFGCSEDDIFHTKFSAIGKNGERVTGVACSGWFKGTTIRFN